MGAVVDGDARERVPLAEEHAIALVPFGVAHVERAGCRPAGAAAGIARTAAPIAATRARERLRREARPRPPSDRAAAVRTTPGRAQRVQQRDERQAAGGGAKQVGRIEQVDRVVSRANASEMTPPPVKNGSAASSVDREHQREVLAGSS